MSHRPPELSIASPWLRNPRGCGREPLLASRVAPPQHLWIENDRDLAAFQLHCALHDTGQIRSPIEDAAKVSTPEDHSRFQGFGSPANLAQQ